MIIYTTKSERLPRNVYVTNDPATFYRMLQYDYDLFQRCRNFYNYDGQKQLTQEVFYTHHALVDFNNSLDGNYEDAFIKLKSFLNEHKEVKDSLDYRCKNYYDKMCYWYKKYKESPSEETINDIKLEVQSLMCYLDKQGIIKKSGCNLKRNYY